MSKNIDWIDEATAGMPALVTANEAALLLRTSPRNVRRMVADGRITGVRARETGSSRLLVPSSEIGRYLRGLVSP